MRNRKITLLVALAATAVSIAPASGQDSTARRQELIEKRRQLAEELREVERLLGRDRLTNVFSFGRDLPGVVTWSSSRAQLGVVVQTRSDSETDDIGAVLESVTPGGPADEAGLQPGDIIVSFDGRELTGNNPDARPGESAPARRLIDLVREMDVGDDVAVEYRRDGQVNRTTATLRRLDNPSVFEFTTGDQPHFDFVVGSNPNRLRTSPVDFFDRGGSLITALVSGVWADIELVSLNEELGQYFGTSEGLLVIRAPDQDGVDLRGGDVILGIDGREPRSPTRALRIFRSYEAGESMSVDIMRDGRRMTVEFAVPESNLFQERLRERRRRPF